LSLVGVRDRLVVAVEVVISISLMLIYPLEVKQSLSAVAVLLFLLLAGVLLEPKTVTLQHVERITVLVVVQADRCVTTLVRRLTDT
jgi:hypothetical protein